MVCEITKTILHLLLSWLWITAETVYLTSSLEQNGQYVSVYSTLVLILKNTRYDYTLL